MNSLAEQLILESVGKIAEVKERLSALGVEMTQLKESDKKKDAVIDSLEVKIREAEKLTDAVQNLVQELRDANKTRDEDFRKLQDEMKILMKQVASIEGTLKGEKVVVQTGTTITNANIENVANEVNKNG